MNRTFVLLAGEPSGDFLGAMLMRSMQRLSPEPLSFYGIGGPLMQEAGLQCFFPVESLSIVGFVEVIPKIPQVFRCLREAKRRIEALAPAAVVTIDFPGFNYRLAKRLKPLGIPLIHYVAPTVWALLPGRAKSFAKVFDHILALFSFEPPYFPDVPVTFVGHPLTQNKLVGNPAAFAPERTWIVVLPGSRTKEVKTLLPVFQEAVGRLLGKYPTLAVVLPTVPAVQDLVAASLPHWPCPAVMVMGPQEKQDAYAAGKVALAASGTVSLELAQAGLPMVIAYKGSPINAFLARRLLKIPYVSLVNILNAAPIVPELLQENCTPAKLADALDKLLGDALARRTQIEAGRTAIQKITAPDPDVAARTVLQIGDSR